MRGTIEKFDKHLIYKPTEVLKMINFIHIIINIDDGHLNIPKLLFILYLSDISLNIF